MNVFEGITFMDYNKKYFSFDFLVTGEKLFKKLSKKVINLVFGREILI